MKEIILNFIKINGGKLLALSKLGFIGALQTIAKGIIQLWTIFIKPFFFSSNKKSIIVPYVYIGIAMGLFFATVIEFLKLSHMAATVGIKDAAIVLPTLAGVIATLIAIVAVMGKTYNDGVANQTSAPTEPEKPNGVQ